MNMHDEHGHPMRNHAVVSAFAIAFALLAVAACSPERDHTPIAAPSSARTPASAAIPDAADERTCTNEPRTDENDKRPRCEGMGATPPAARAYRVVGGSGDPVDQVVCDIEQTFVLDGKLFGVELSGGIDGTYRFVRTPNIPGLSWTAAGRYHIEFPDGADQPGTLTTAGGGTTTAGSTSRATSGGERFTLTPVDACMQSTAASE